MEFVYNNIKNANIDYMFFELNYRYHPWVCYKKDLDLHSNLKIAEKLFFKI